MLTVDAAAAVLIVVFVVAVVVVYWSDVIVITTPSDTSGKHLNGQNDSFACHPIRYVYFIMLTLIVIFPLESAQEWKDKKTTLNGLMKEFKRWIALNHDEIRISSDSK